MGKYHLVCNQNEHCWEICDKHENVIKTGTLKDMKVLIEKLNEI